MNYCTKCKKVLTKREMKGDGAGYTSTGSYFTCIYCGECCQFTSKNTRNEGVPVKPGDNEPEDKKDLKKRYCKKCDKWLNHPASYDSYSYSSPSGGLSSRNWIECRTCHEEMEFAITDSEVPSVCNFCKKIVRTTGEKEPKTNMERMLPFTNTEGKVNHECEGTCCECEAKIKHTDENFGLLNHYGTVYCITCRIKDLEGSEKAEEKDILAKLKKIKNNSPTSPGNGNNGDNNNNGNGNSGGGNQSGGNNNQNSLPSLDFLSQLQAYFIANKIESIVKKPNGDLLVKFETNAQSQTITETDANMDNEQKNMWKKFKEWMKKKNKTSLDKKELEKEIEKLNKSSAKPNNYTPLIIGGCVVGGILVIGLIALFLRKKRIKK